MQINVTHLVDEDLTRFSASAMELGPYAGEITWKNSVAHATESTLLDAEGCAEARDWLAKFGAWEREELDAMQDVEICALVLQFIVSEIRTMQEFGSLEESEEAAEAGRVSGCLWRADDGEWFYDLV